MIEQFPNYYGTLHKAPWETSRNEDRNSIWFHFYYTLNFHVLFLLALNTCESLKGFKKPGRKEQVSSLHTWNSSVTKFVSSLRGQVLQ